MAYSIKYEFNEINRYFDLLGYGVIDQVNDDIGNELVAVSMQAFENETDPVTGQPWKQSIRAKLEGGQTLSDNANLKRSIGFNILPDGVEVGTALHYGRIHQEGGTIQAKGKMLKFKIGGKDVFKKSVKIPPRRFLGTDPDFGNRLFSNSALQARLEGRG